MKFRSVSRSKWRFACMRCSALSAPMTATSANAFQVSPANQHSRHDPAGSPFVMALATRESRASWVDRALHSLEQMHVRFADRQRFLALLQLHAHMPGHVARDPGNGIDVDERATVDLPERLRIELVDQLLDGAADEGFLLSRDDERVL